MRSKVAGEDYKPVFVPLRAIAIRLRRTLLHGSSDLPGSLTERAAPPPLFGLAPRGVCPAIRITPDAVRSYRTFSPLPMFSPTGPKHRRFVFCGTFRESPFEGPPPAVSRHAALWRPDFPLIHTSGYPSVACQPQVSHTSPFATFQFLHPRPRRTARDVAFPIGPRWRRQHRDRHHPSRLPR